MFKRVRVNAGDTLLVKLDSPVGYRRVIRSQITKGSGTPIARFNIEHGAMNEIVATVSPDATSRMSGTYKYEIAMDVNGIVKTVQYGILEVM